ncbi:MAG: hypothetical protein NTW29_08985 [Bacteroidetes bacterium]|nr:hypothetical protein [Bacteroidota bacterium]
MKAKRISANFIFHDCATELPVANPPSLRFVRQALFPTSQPLLAISPTANRIQLLAGRNERLVQRCKQLSGWTEKLFLFFQKAVTIG